MSARPHTNERFARVEMDMSVVSGANLREHWARRAKRAADHRKRAWLACFGITSWVPFAPVTVTLTRVAPRALDDDNLAYAFKAVRDGVADALQVRDNDPRIVWNYTQEKGPARVVITFEGKGPQ